MTPLENLTEEVAAILASDSGPERKKRLLVLTARSYAAAQVELHARGKPWPWPPRRPEPHQLAQGAGAQHKQEAS